MKKVLAILAVISGTALAVTGSIKFHSEVQPASRGIPTGPGDFTPDAAFSLRDLKGFRVTVCSVQGDPLGSGVLKPYLLNEETGQVSHNSTLSFTLVDAGIAATTYCQNSPDFEVAVPAGKVIYATSGMLLADGGSVLTDAGTQAFRVYYTGWSNP